MTINALDEDVEWKIKGFGKGFLEMRDHFFVLCVALGVVAGCQSETEVARSKIADNEQATSQSSENEPSDLGAKSAANDPSSGDQNDNNVTDMPAPTDAPDQVCRAFMTMLQAGEVESASQLITRKAQVLTHRYKLPLTFPGEADASFQVGDAKFATSKEELAQVVCEIEDEHSEDQQSSEIGWMLKLENRGWRICGMLLPAGEDEPMDFISFENAKDLDRVKAMLASDLDDNNLQATAE